MEDSRKLITIAELPAEILNYMFTFLLVPSVLRHFRFYYVGRSFWSSNLRDLKAISSVCRLWREESIRYLYEYITIYRPYHLEALLESLQVTPQYSRYIRRFEITAAGALDDYTNDSTYNSQKDGPLFAKLFQCCPNLTSLTIGPGLLGFWNTRALFSLDWVPALAPLSSQLTDLTIRADYQMSYKKLCEIIVAFGPNLISLSIEDHSSGLYDSPHPEISELKVARLPRLQSLTLYCNSDVVDPVHWKMDSLRALTISHNYGSTLLRKYGAQLDYLCILGKDVPRDSVQTYCPSLKHLVMSSRNATIPDIKHIDFWVEDVQPSLVPTASSRSTYRYLDADLLQPEFGFPTLPYHFPPTNKTQVDASFVGGDSHHIQITEQGRVFQGTNCRAGSLRPVTTYAPSKPAELDSLRSKLRVRRRLRRIRKDSHSSRRWFPADFKDDSDPDSDWEPSESENSSSDSDYDTDSSWAE